MIVAIIAAIQIPIRTPALRPFDPPQPLSSLLALTSPSPSPSPSISSAGAVYIASKPMMGEGNWRELRDGVTDAVIDTVGVMDKVGDKVGKVDAVEEVVGMIVGVIDGVCVSMSGNETIDGGRR